MVLRSQLDAVLMPAVFGVGRGDGNGSTHKMIPNVITIPGMVVDFLGAVTVLPVGVINSVLGLTLGGGILWLIRPG